MAIQVVTLRTFQSGYFKSGTPALLNGMCWQAPSALLSALRLPDPPNLKSIMLNYHKSDWRWSLHSDAVLLQGAGREGGRRREDRDPRQIISDLPGTCWSVPLKNFPSDNKLNLITELRRQLSLRFTLSVRWLNYMYDVRARTCEKPRKQRVRRTQLLDYVYCVWSSTSTVLFPNTVITSRVSGRGNVFVVCVCLCVCVCLSVWAITFEWVDIENSFLVWCYILTISRSSLSYKVIGSRPRSSHGKC